MKVPEKYEYLKDNSGKRDPTKSRCKSAIQRLEECKNKNKNRKAPQKSDDDNSEGESEPVQKRRWIQKSKATEEAGDQWEMEDGTPEFVEGSLKDHNMDDEDDDDMM